MILVDEFIKLNVSEEFMNMFLVVIQLGAILAVCVLFFHELNPFSRARVARAGAPRGLSGASIVLACLPAAIFGIPLDDFMEEHLYNSVVVAAALIVYGIAFIVIEMLRKRVLGAPRRGGGRGPGQPSGRARTLLAPPRRSSPPRAATLARSPAWRTCRS